MLLNFRRAIAPIVLLCLVVLMTSCRSDTVGAGDATVTSGDPTTVTSTSAVSVTTTATTAATTTATEPPLAESVGESLSEIFNRQLERLFAEEASAGDVDAEEMLDAMLPYLMGGEEQFSSGDRYHLHHVSVTGEGIAMPQEIISADGVTLTVGEDPEVGAYREIEVQHENGVVYLSTYDGLTTVDGVDVQEENDPLGDLDSAAMALSAEHLTAGGEDGIWDVSDLYTRQLLRALLGREAVASLKNNDMSCTLDATAFDGMRGRLLLQMQLNAPIEMRIEVCLEGIGESRERMEMSISAAEESEIRLASAMTDGVMEEMAMYVRMGESETEVVQRVSGQHTDLTMQVRAGDTVNLSCELSLDMISESEGRGTIEVVFRTNEQTENPILPLSATSPESVAKGKFSIRQNGDQIGAMTMEITTHAGTVVSETSMKTVQSGAEVGESVMYYSVHMRDSADPTLESAVEMDVRLTTCAGDVSEYALGITAVDARGTSTVTATVTTPSSVKPEYTAQETLLIGRARAFLQSYESYMKEAETTLDRVLQNLTASNIHAYPATFYVTDSDHDGIVVLIQRVYTDDYYLYADILLDVENYDYFYDGYDSSLYLAKPSGLRTDSSRMGVRATERQGYIVVDQGGNAIYYSYQEEEELYVLWDMSNGDYGYMWEEPTAEDFPGRVLHRAEFTAEGVPVGEIHAFVVTYDELCHEVLLCADCQLMLKSYEPRHQIETDAVVCEAVGRQPRTVIGSCRHCDDVKRLVLTDPNGSELHLTLKSLDGGALAESVAIYTKYLLDYVDPVRDLRGHYVIAGASLTGDSFASDVIIPDLRRVTGETILGVGVTSPDDRYMLPAGLDLHLCLPEGMEFLIGSETTTGLWHTVGSLDLPETMVYIDALFEKSPLRELEIPASVRYLDADMSFPQLEQLTIRANMDVLPEIHAPRLEVLSLLGKFRVIKGVSGRAPLEELHLPEGVEEIGMSSFSHLKNLKKLTLPESLTVIPDHAFRGCSSLESLRIPDTVTEIGQSAFADCEALTEIILSTGLENLRFGVFESAKSLKQVTLPANIKSLDSAVFRNCVSLEKVEVLGELTYVGYDAFYNCPKLKDVPTAVDR